MNSKTMNSKIKFNQWIYYKNVFIFGILVVITAFFTIVSDGFLNNANIFNIFRSAVLIVITGTAATFLLVAGYIDLSIGSTLALACMTFAMACNRGIPIIISLIIAMGAGAIIGLINGLVIVKLNIPAIITTLGTLYFAKGLTFMIFGISPIAGKLPGFSYLGRGAIGNIPFQAVIIVVVAGIFYFLEKKSLLFKYAVATGGNITAASLAGINVKKLVTGLYVITGTMAGLSGAIMASKLSIGQQQVGYGFEFDVIVAMLLGGTSFTGGQGSVIGTVIGAFILTVLDIGFNMIGISSFYQYVVKGIILVGAVALDNFLRNKVKEEI